MNDISFSACLMVKNEAHNIERCIKSIWALEIIDEILIFDTGSTDDTPAIAAALGAKVRIAENPDEYFIETRFGKFLNFSKARNASMEGATGDWLLLMDADEEIIGDGKAVRRAVRKLDKNPDVEGIAINLEDIQGGQVAMSFPPARFFRNGCVRFEEIVHNRPEFKPPAIYLEDVEIKVRHYGYDLDDEGRRRKWERTTGLLEVRFAENPDDSGPLFYLAQQYAGIDDHKRAIDYAVKYIALRPYNKRFNASIFVTLIRSCMATNQVDMADKWIAAAMREIGDDLDIAAAILDFGLWQNKPFVVEKGAEKLITAFDNLQRNPIASQMRFVYANNDYFLTKALFHFGMISLMKGFQALKRFSDVIDKMENRKYADTAAEDLRREMAHLGIRNYKEILSDDRSQQYAGPAPQPKPAEKPKPKKDNVRKIVGGKRKSKKQGGKPIKYKKVAGATR